MTHKALFSLTPAESKRLIGLATVAEPAVQRALERGVVVVTLGTTNAAVLEALTGHGVAPLRFSAGVVQQGCLCPTPAADRLPPAVFVDGQPVDQRPREAIVDSSGTDVVVIKGGNAIDPQGRVGVLMAAADGGTVGQLLVLVRAAGLTLLAPVGLEKLVPDVPAACAVLGQRQLDHAVGARCGMMELVGARAVTEIEALAALANVHAVHVASGGVCGSEGSVTLAVTGTTEAITRTMALVESVKHEAMAISAPLRPRCAECTAACDFAGMSDAQLPDFVRPARS